MNLASSASSIARTNTTKRPPAPAYGYRVTNKNSRQKSTLINPIFNKTVHRSNNIFGSLVNKEELKTVKQIITTTKNTISLNLANERNTFDNVSRNARLILIEAEEKSSLSEIRCYGCLIPSPHCTVPCRYPQKCFLRAPSPNSISKCALSFSKWAYIGVAQFCCSLMYKNFNITISISYCTKR